jgi:hypothetical protein
MRRAFALGLALLVLLLARPVAGQPDPIVGDWRGTLTSAQGTGSPIVITIVTKGDGYSGVTSGLSESSEVALKRVTLTGDRVSLEAAADSKLGQIVLAADLTVAGNALKGPGTLSVGPQRFDVTFSLQRRPRSAVLQRHIEQRADYFVGRWKFEYLGGEFPPLSAGSRTGTTTFSTTGASNFVAGQIEGEVLGRPYRETQAIGFDSATKMLVAVEHRGDGLELLSLGNWQSPLAIVFQTSPVQAGGRTYQLRRVVSIRSDTAFDVTEEFSVDGGPYRRLGNGHYTKLQ